MNPRILTLVAALTSLPLSAAEIDQEQAAARAIAASFGGQLQAALKPALQQKGAVAAIDLCHTEAAPIAAEQARRSGWAVGRTSLRVRNPDNQPDGWEQAVLEQFEARKRAGEAPASLEWFERVAVEGGTELRYMKAIPTGPVCLNCHGQQLAPEVSARLDQLYPDDRARGFAEGDLRGAFSLRKRLD
ncbi:Tll0287-like domain-containing protein [Aestuariirhabdus litorea]|uniref:DUF3365 domain-containing protein n=1 Tax=Aestuariirhabdus litorea TaxID=2528527 RepID=A0A3P3VMS1_9GAMM|nr:DUF3365 domain-containing protein [Aestuariirhabdus litorea]RRJ84062.1 DUF3365 domain-containing protein [Aestuariirhabdus litorea]RWW97282.1 DUF3365 domain-containing protein [Endozoicomonadaceae bacterium GTF-13]